MKAESPLGGGHPDLAGITYDTRLVRARGCKHQPGRHLTPRSVARCRWGKPAEWIIGTGRWATVAWCSVLTVELHTTLDDADRALKAINDTGCGHACWGPPMHELVMVLGGDER
jgi:hypothetical protein